MISELKDITNTFLNTPRSPPQKKVLAPPPPSLRELITLNLDCIDFKQCIPGTVHERRLGITLREPQLEPRIITISIACHDQRLNELPEYIFGVRKENSYEYFDQFRFKAVQRGTYNFIVGVKTPAFPDYQVAARLLITAEGASGVLEVPLTQRVVVPFVHCSKELISEEGFRMIKLAAVRGRSKKETKVVFRCSENLNFTLLTDIIGLNEEKDVEVKPKTLQLGGKGMFVLNFSTNFPEEIEEEKIIVRKVLVLQIKDTPCHFHFPIELSFYPQTTHPALE